MEIVEGTTRYFQSKKITMWNIPLPFKRGLHLEMARFYLEIGLYNWNTGSYSELFSPHFRRQVKRTAKEQETLDYFYSICPQARR